MPKYLSVLARARSDRRYFPLRDKLTDSILRQSFYGLGCFVNGEHFGGLVLFDLALALAVEYSFNSGGDCSYKLLSFKYVILLPPLIL